MPRNFQRWMRFGRYVLCFTYADPRGHAAGVEKYLSDELDLLKARGISTIYLFPFPTKRSKWLNRHLSRYWGVVVDRELRGFFDMEGIVGIVAELQNAGCIPTEIQIHHLLNYNLSDVESLLRRIPVDVRLFLHDYYTICPQLNLLRNNKVYCGAETPTQQKCEGCVRWTPTHIDGIRKVLVAAKGHLTIVAPSESARRIWLNTFSDYETQTMIVPHLVPVGEVDHAPVVNRETDPIRIAFVGAPKAHKGWDVFVRLVEDLASVHMDYKFYHFGRKACIRGDVIHVPVSFLRDGPDAMTEALRRAHIDVALLWSTWPETYSYTLQESLLAHAMVITNPDSGNVADTIQREGEGRIFLNYDELLRYAQDIARVRRDVDEFRSRHARLPARLEANPSIADSLAAKPSISVEIKGHAARICYHVVVLYGLKRWKKSVWDREV